MEEVYCLSGKVQGGDIYLNGSKSITNRALVMAALSKGDSILKNASKSDDSAIMCNALAACGISISWQGNDLLVHSSGSVAPLETTIDIGAAGTAARFMTALLALTTKGEVILDGNERMRERPIAPLVDALLSINAKVEYLGKVGSLPLRIAAGCFDECCQAKRILIDGTISSQYITALLLTAPLQPHGLKLEITGNLVSKSYIDMTIAGMADFGVTVLNDSYRVFYVEGGQSYRSRSYLIEGDASGASYFLGLAAISGDEIKVHNISEESTQGDVKFARVLEKMGCKVNFGQDKGTPWIAVKREAELKAVDVDMSSMPDTVQTLAVVAALAKGKSHISGISTLRNKETDRIFAIIHELKKIGVTANCGQDVLEIEGGGEIIPATIKTYSDHRMAMAFAMLAGRYEGICIEDPKVVSKSMPEFWEKLLSLGIQWK